LKLQAQCDKKITGMTAFAIETHQLKKTYGEKTAVRDLTLTVGCGEVFGFLGPNGAGKTTSIKMLLGLVSPASGTGRLLGAPIGDPAARTKVGFLPEHFRFHEWLTGAEFLALHAELYRMNSRTAKQRIPELLELVGLTGHAGFKLRGYSKGMLQRIGLAQALLNEPELVFLDEPTSGMDPLGRRLVRDIIRELRDRGTAVFLNSHLLSEVEITCDRVAFISNGTVIRTENLAELAKGRVHLEVRAKGVTPEVLNRLEQLAGEISQKGNVLTLYLPDESKIPALNCILVEQGVEVFSLLPQRVSLEELFIELVGKDGGL
jgi:ABC-2 type transport system ATP-binding protein